MAKKIRKRLPNKSDNDIESLKFFQEIKEGLGIKVTNITSIQGCRNADIKFYQNIVKVFYDNMEYIKNYILNEKMEMVVFLRKFSRANKSFEDKLTKVLSAESASSKADEKEVCKEGPSKVKDESGESVSSLVLNAGLERTSSGFAAKPSKAESVFASVFEGDSNWTRADAGGVTSWTRVITSSSSTSLSKTGF